MIDDARFTQEAAEQMPSLYRLSMSILHASADAQDAVQQGLMRAWERRAQVVPERFRAWLMRIVINECRNIQRKRMRVFPSDKIPRSEWREEGTGELAHAMEALSEKLRTPLLLRYMEGFSESEIAQALGVPVTTVKSRLYRARQALKRELEAEVTFE